MLNNNTIGYISKNYNNFQKLMDQMNTGKKISKPSDDPVIAMKGMRYRTEVREVKQFQRNLTEGYTWMDNADAALSETNKVLQRVRELLVQASNDTYGPEERKSIATEISQLQEHVEAVANTKVGDNYIFNGTDTATAPIDLTQVNIDFNTFAADLAAAANSSDVLSQHAVNYKGINYSFKEVAELDATGTPTGTMLPMFVSADGQTIEVDKATGSITHKTNQTLDYMNGQQTEVTTSLQPNDIVLTHLSAVSSNNQTVEIEVMKGVIVPINIQSNTVFSTDLFAGLESIKKMLNDSTTTGKDLTKTLDTMDKLLSDVSGSMSEIGARVNRLEMVEARLMVQEGIATDTMSKNEDADLEEVIMNLTIQESLQQASLAAGAKIIQPTLLDFLR